MALAEPGGAYVVAGIADEGRCGFLCDQRLEGDNRERPRRHDDEVLTADQVFHLPSRAW